MENHDHEIVYRAGGEVFPVDRDRSRDQTLRDDRVEAQSLAGFIRRAWKIVEPATDLIRGDHIEAICDHLQAVTTGQIRNLLINLPPRHMKSLTVSVFWPVWEWISVPSRRWLFASYAASLSTRDSLRCRRLIESDWFQARWGDRFMLTTDQNEKMRFENDKTGCRIATSVGGSATGEGGDRVVVDDPHNVAERESDAVREAALIWWDETMSTRLNDPKTGARVIVMQRIHEKDLAGHVLAQGGYVHLCLPAEFDPGRRCVTMLPWKDERTFEGELLWPERISQSEISDFKLRLGPVGYAGQFQQQPAPAGGSRFRAEWFRYYRKYEGEMRGYGDAEKDQYAVEMDDGRARLLPSRSVPREEAPGSAGASPSRSEGFYLVVRPDGTAHQIPVNQCQRIAVMDPAGTERNQNTRPCYTVIQVWDITPAYEMLLVHQYRAQVQAPDSAAAAIRIAREFGVEYIAIEKDGLGLGIVQTVKHSGIAVKALKAQCSKDARSETAEIRMAAGMIYFPQGAPFVWELEQELIHFPHGEYCDQVDALAHAARLVQNRGGPPTTQEAAADAAPMDVDSDADLFDGWTE